MPDREALDRLADRNDATSRLLARRERARRQDLVGAFDHQEVREVDADRTHLDDDVCWAWGGVRDVLDDDGRGRPELPHTDCTHELPAPLSLRASGPREVVAKG